MVAVGSAETGEPVLGVSPVVGDHVKATAPVPPVLLAVRLIGLPAGLQIDPVVGETVTTGTGFTVKVTSLDNAVAPPLVQVTRQVMKAVPANGTTPVKIGDVAPGIAVYGPPGKMLACHWKVRPDATE